LPKPHIIYDDLDALAHLPTNPKGHDLGAIGFSLARWGLIDQIVVNDTTGHIIAGNGRVDSLRALHAAGKAPPMGVTVEGGRWLVPVVHGLSVPVEQEAAAALALNRVHDLGGYNEETLAAVLHDLLAADQLSGTGYNQADVEFLARNVGPIENRFATTPSLPEDPAIEGEATQPRVIVLFEDAAERDAFWQRVGWQPDNPETVSYRWRDLEALLSLTEEPT
jgi:hypothetical protein